MLNVHNIVGTLVVAGYLALTVLNVVQIGGRSITWVRYVSYAAATLLLLQLLLGFSLWGQPEYQPQTSHWVIALLALLTVGLEHGYANTRPTLRSRASIGAVATALTFILVLTAHIIGSRN